MRQHSWKKPCFLLLFLHLGAFVLLVSSAAAQLPTATISGVVKDSSGAIVPGAAVTVTNAETGMTRTAQTGNEGAYRFPALQVGIYDVRVEQTGFQTKVQAGQRITVGQEAVLNFALDVGAVTETVSVTAEAPIVNTTSGSLSSMVNEQTVSDLPLDGRNYNDLTLLQTGVVENKLGSGRSANGIQFSTNGAPVRSNLFMLDGTIMNDLHNYGGASTNDMTLGVEGILEYRVVTNAFSAEYGMTMGSQIVMVTKSGTNELHGSLFEYFRNSALDARNWTDIPNKAPLKQNNFGVALGGPIRHDKFFYFGTYEGLRLRRSLSPTKAQTQVPSLAARAGDINGDGTPEVVVAESVKPYLQFWPAPNAVDPKLASSGIGIYNYTYNPKSREDYAQMRNDYNISSSDTLFGRYTLNDAASNGTDPMLRPDIEGNNFSSRNQWMTLSDNHIFSPALLATFRGSFSRTRSSSTYHLNTPPELSFVPGQPMGQLGIANIFDYANIGPQSMFKLNQRIISVSDDNFYTHGKHALKFGTLINFYRQYVNNGSGNDPRGLWSFTDLAAFLTAKPTQFSALTPGSNTGRTWDYETLGFYLQDDLRVAPRFTLNLGLRYEFMTELTEIHGDGAALRDVYHDAVTTPGALYLNPSKRNFSPRFGFAWDIRGDGKTALRGGFAQLYDLGNIGSSLFIASSATPPLSSTSTVRDPAPVFGPNVFIPANSVGNSIRMVDYHLQQPHILSYNLTLERQLPASIGLTVAYAGSRGINLMVINEGDPTVPVGTPSVVNGQLTCLNVSPAPTFNPTGLNCWAGSDPQQNSNWQTIELHTAAGNSWYNSMQVQVQKQMSHGFQFQSAYTISHAIDEWQSQGQDGGGTNNYPANRRLNKANTVFDVPNNWRFNAIYSIPSNRTGMWGKLANGWRASGILGWSNGLPFTPALTFNRALTLGPSGTGSGARPNLAPGVNFADITQGVSAGCLGFPAETPLGTPQHFFDPCAFTIQPLGFLGNAGRSILRGPNQGYLNFSLVKDTKLPGLGEAGSLEFRAEFFNLLNHPSLSNPSATVYTAKGKSVTSYAEAPLANAGQIGSTYSKSREIQFALKILF